MLFNPETLTSLKTKLGIITAAEDTNNKDATGGYAGLTLFKINFKNAANTFTSFFTNSNTAARTYTFPDKDITVAGIVDLSGSILKDIDYSVASNALTLKVNPSTTSFRSTTLSIGTPISVANAAQITTTISSGSTGGTISGVQSTIVILEINNAGTKEVAWCNLAGGISLDETQLINTTAEGGAGGATSATTIYSTTARTGVAYRVAGILQSTQSTAGVWGNPTLVQGAGGNVCIRSASMVRLNTANGYGSTNTKIRRFTNVVTNQGSDVTYADSATLGATFTINANGVYAISYNDQFNAAGSWGISLNSSQLTTGISGVSASDILAVVEGLTANYPLSVSVTAYLLAGSVIRAHSDGMASGGNTNMCQFTITRGG
jgi:hypothetical protein